MQCNAMQNAVKVGFKPGVLGKVHVCTQALWCGAVERAVLFGTRRGRACAGRCIDRPGVPSFAIDCFLARRGAYVNTYSTYILYSIVVCSACAAQRSSLSLSLSVARRGARLWGVASEKKKRLGGCAALRVKRRSTTTGARFERLVDLHSMTGERHGMCHRVGCIWTGDPTHGNISRLERESSD